MGYIQTALTGIKHWLETDDGSDPARTETLEILVSDYEEMLDMGMDFDPDSGEVTGV